MHQYFLDYRSHFDAAHFLRGYCGACANLHGHRWEVEIRISGSELNPVGILVDFKLLKAMLETILPDHCCLNDLPGFEVMNPTAENLAAYIFRRVQDWMVGHPDTQKLWLEHVRVWEAPGASVTVKGVIQ